MTAVVGTAPGRVRSRRRGRFSARLEPYLYLSPALLLLALVMVVPLLVGLSYAFRNIQLFNPFATGWVGFAHFGELVHDASFWHALFDTVWWTGGSLAFQFSLGLILALALAKPFFGRRLVQAIVFVPWAVPTFLSGLAWAWLFNPLIGPLPHWLAALDIIAEPYNILSDPGIAMWGPIVANVWFGIPFFAITLLAALQAIPRELYEAAEIDGADAWQRFMRVTLPLLAPTIAITVLLRTIWIANFADLIWVMTNGGPADSTQTLATYIFATAYSKLDFGYASAVAAVLLLLLLLYAILLIRMRRGLLAAPMAA
jgi:multiple sugar transport system permease protein